MAKTIETETLEYLVYDYLFLRRGLSCALEVQVPIGARADFVGIDKKNQITVVEIKTTRQDFRSDSGHNFIGNKNYYALPEELYEEVKNEIPNHVGVLINDNYYSSYYKIKAVKPAKTIKHNYPQRFIDKIRANIETAKQSNVRRLLYYRHLVNTRENK